VLADAPVFRAEEAFEGYRFTPESEVVLDEVELYRWALSKTSSDTAPLTGWGRWVCEDNPKSDSMS
jgi:hypothetical protein